MLLCLQASEIVGAVPGVIFDTLIPLSEAAAQVLTGAGNALRPQSPIIGGESRRFKPPGP